MMNWTFNLVLGKFLFKNVHKHSSMMQKQMQFVRSRNLITETDEKDSNKKLT